jgi:anti-sigma factor RsiW
MSISRDEAMLLLPFLANGTLEGDELRQVEQAVENDPTLGAELAALRSIRLTMQSDPIDYSPGEIGLARLMREVELERKDAAPAGNSIWKIAAAMLLAVAVGQAVLLTMNRNQQSGYTLAGETQAAFSITIQPNATEAELRAVLLDAGVEIVSGPSALGIYGLALTQGVSSETAAVELRNASDIIETLEIAD